MPEEGLDSTLANLPFKKTSKFPSSTKLLDHGQSWLNLFACLHYCLLLGLVVGVCILGCLPFAAVQKPFWNHSHV
jgi:hypothetical protein